MENAVWDLKSQMSEYKDKKVFDCMIADYLLSYGKSIPQLPKALEKYKVSSIEDLATNQQSELETLPELKQLFINIEMPLVDVLWTMEQRGITLDTTRLKKVGEHIDQEIQTLVEKINNHIGFEINLNSPTQIGNYLVEKEQVPLKKTKTGKYATGESELVQYKAQFPIIEMILTYRMLAKLRSTYVDTLITKIDADSRVHTTYHQVAVSTGRLASTNPNLQNIPVTSEFGQKIKSCFVATDGYTLVSFDYSQQELRVLAHLTGEDKLIDAFNNKRDVHKTTASQIFSVEYEEVTSQQRSVGKTINFGIIYGMSSYGLSHGLSIPVEQAQTFIDTFYETYPKIKTFYDSYFKQAKIDGYVQTMLGRRRYVFEYPGQKFIDNSTRRVLLNYPIQGSAADIMKKAMIAVQRDVLSTHKDTHLLLQIHDDLVFEVKETTPKNFDTFITSIKDTMCNVHPLIVPVEVGVKVGTMWGEMKEYLPEN